MNFAESSEVYYNNVAANEAIQLRSNEGMDFEFKYSFGEPFAEPRTVVVNNSKKKPYPNATWSISALTKDILAEAVEISGLGTTEQEVAGIFQSEKTVNPSEILEPNRNELENIRRNKEMEEWCDQMEKQRESLSTPTLVQSRSIDEFDSLQKDLPENTAPIETTDTTIAVEIVPSNEKMVRRQITYHHILNILFTPFLIFYLTASTNQKYSTRRQTQGRL